MKLWSLIRRGQIDGHHFRKQVPTGPFVADFACLKRRLIIDVDGGQHAWRNGPDTERTRQLEALGYKVLRFWNNEILQNPEGVLLHLHQALNETSDDHAKAH
jgi:very-short-patch-repair endonuclease